MENENNDDDGFRKIEIKEAYIGRICSEKFSPYGVLILLRASYILHHLPPVHHHRQYRHARRHDYSDP